MTAHWDHEPTPNPSQEGNFRGVDDRLLPSREGSGVGRFMDRAIHSPRGTAAARRAGRISLLSAQRFLPILICLLVRTPRIAAAETAAPSNDYSAVEAIFTRHCLECHGSTEPEGKLIMESHEVLMKGGESGVVIVPGKSE